MTAIINILGFSWDMFLDSSTYMLFGLFCAERIYAYSNTEMIGNYLGKGRVGPVFLSALVVIPIPLCSCGVVSAAVGLKKQNG